ncbi:MAG: 3-dehydroquinate synthase [Clostridiales bacterium]|nr:3-dehydroquinate synthase [Clostridiales bacterium]
MTTLRMELGKNSYDITVEGGSLQKAGKYLDLERKVLIVTDDGVPAAYANTLAAQCKEPCIVTVKEGEGSKSFPVLEMLLQTMLGAGFSRGDAVAAVGGGVVGDLAGFAAATYMRGIDFYNIPTTLLSEVDSSIGGKVAVNLGDVKNIVGAFYQPKAVLIDPDTLKTLPERQLRNGLAEAVKMAACFDEAAFRRYYEEGDILPHIDAIIESSLRIKKAVVEQDEREQGLRKLLNFGHTLGHGIESVCGMEQDRAGGLYHGECVAVGMLPMCGGEAKVRLSAVLEKIGLPTKAKADPMQVMAALAHDKKAAGSVVTVAKLDRIGEGYLEKTALSALSAAVKEAVL